jgi:hypothetical protein
VQTPSEGRSFARAALGPLPLACLAAGGIAGAAVAWPLAGAGALAWAVAAALGVGGGSRGGAHGLREPEAPSVPVRSTEVMAHVVRVRKAHAALYRALRDGDASVRAILASSYERLCGSVAGAYDLARRADQVKAELDAKPSERARLEPAYAELAARLVDVSRALEDAQARVVAAASAPADAERCAKAVAEELERMGHLVRALDQVRAG